MLDMTDRGTMAATLPNGGRVFEVGVQKGDYANMIMQFNKPSELVLIDCWEQQSVVDYGHDPANVANDEQAVLEKITRDRFADNPEVRIIKAYSQDAVKQFEDEYFDWGYLDANHLRLREELDSWLPKVKRGGWLCGHDYCIFDDFIIVQPILDRFVAEVGAELHVVTNEDFPSWAFQRSNHVR